MFKKYEYMSIIDMIMVLNTIDVQRVGGWVFNPLKLRNPSFNPIKYKNTLHYPLKTF